MRSERELSKLVRYPSQPQNLLGLELVHASSTLPLEQFVHQGHERSASDALENGIGGFHRGWFRPQMVLSCALNPKVLPVDSATHWSMVSDLPLYPKKSSLKSIQRESHWPIASLALYLACCILGFLSLSQSAREKVKPKVNSCPLRRHHDCLESIQYEDNRRGLTSNIAHRAFR